MPFGLIVRLCIGPYGLKPVCRLCLWVRWRLYKLLNRSTVLK